MNTTLSARQRLELRAARVLSVLPPRAQLALSGRPPVRVDGQTLEPELQLALSVLERRGAPPLESLPPAEARAAYRHQNLVSGGEPVPVGAVQDLTIEGAEGPLAARHYAPDEGGGPHPLIVFFHGGGFVIGDLDSHDAPCRLLCRHAGVHVLAVDYRLAPEHPFPAAVDDGRAAFAWAAAHAAGLGADAQRVAVAGDSAGGNIAAVVAWEATRGGGPAPVLQVLVYPATNFAEAATRSHQLFGGGFLLTRELMEWFAMQYVDGADPHDPRISVLGADDLSSAAPALVVTAGFDPLRDEGEAYAGRLRGAGVPVVLRRFPGLIHSFFNAVGTSRVSREAVIEIAGATRALLARGKDSP